MEFYILFSALIFFAYSWMIFRFVGLWDIEPDVKIPDDFIPEHTICVIIPARNEASNIEACIRSCIHQSYPDHLIQIIVIDDFSEDHLMEIVGTINDKRVQPISLSNHFPELANSANKKKAIEFAISQTEQTLIVTLDADCIAPNDWLRSISFKLANNQGRMVVSPVDYSDSKGLLAEFQILDLFAMNLVTAAGILGKVHYMAFGANLAYEKAFFEELGGFSNMKLASGDDFFLVQKAEKEAPGSVIYNKSAHAVVKTQPLTKLGDLIHQRLRWGTKNRVSKDKGIIMSSGLTLLTSMNIIILPLALFFSGINLFLIPIIILLLKMTIDGWALNKMAKFFNKKINVKSYPIVALIHISYIAIIGSLSLLLSSYRWKGRRSV